MSDTIHCEVCGKAGRRRALKHCPDGWLYAETLVEAENTQEGQSLVFVLVACSALCALRFWKHGPGDLCTGLQDEEGKGVLASMGIKPIDSTPA